MIQLNDTPLKINMEPKNHPIGKENHLPNLLFWFHVNFPGRTVNGKPDTFKTTWGKGGHDSCSKSCCFLLREFKIVALTIQVDNCSCAS